MSQPLPSLQDAPEAVRNEMSRLRDQLDRTIPPKREVDRNLLVGTWNIRAFGGLTEKWVSSESDSPKRNWRGLAAIAEIVSRFDVIAIQEIVGDLGALRALMKTLAPNWNFLMTDVSLGGKGNNERLGFLFDQRRVQLSGLAGELAVPDDPDVLAALSPDAPFRQFARTPYAVSFRAGRDTFILVTMHVIYGASAEDRTPELKAIAQWMRDWADRTKRWHHNLIVLGDFNIDREGDANFDAFTSTGLMVRDELHAIPRTIFDSSGPKFYDQIAWFEGELTMEVNQAGGIDFSDLLFQAEPELTRRSMSYRVSDHLPLWVEFRGS